MATKNLGRVAFLFKGNYLSTTNYVKFDVAFDGESSYVALQGTIASPNIGHALTDTAYWTPLCKGQSQTNALHVTYEQLVTLRNESKLIAGVSYIIDDYITTYIQPVSLVAMTADEGEPLLITASSTNTLEPVAYSALYPQDIIYYSLDVPTNFASDGFTKGFIFRREVPSRNVSITMDWRHIKYRRWKYNVTTQWISGNNYSKGDIVTDSTSTHIYIAPYDITNSTDINELIRHPHKTTDYGSYLPTGQPISVGSSAAPNFTIPVDANSYTDYLSVTDTSATNSRDFLNVKIGQLYSIPINLASSNFVLIGRLIFITIDSISRSTIGYLSTKQLAYINAGLLQGCIIGDAYSLECKALLYNATMGLGVYIKVGANVIGLLLGHYATTENIDGQQCQLIDIEDHSYGWIIGNGCSGINVGFKSKFGVIGQNSKSINVGHYTNYINVPKNTTNWDIGSNIEGATHTLPAIANDSYYSKMVTKANTNLIVKYDDESGAEQKIVI